MSLTIAVFCATALFYLLSAAILGKAFFAPANAQLSDKSAHNKLGVYCLSLGCIGHLLILLLHHPDMSVAKLSMTFIAAVIALMVTATMLAANSYIKNLVFLPVVALFSSAVLGLYIAAPVSTQINATMSVGLVGHISLSLIAFVLLSISFLYALQIAFINYQLKHKKVGALSANLPPLMAVEHILHKLMFAGTTALGIALATGFIFIPNIFADGYAHKTLLSSIAFFVYLSALIAQHMVGLRARALIGFNLFGLCLLTIAYFGSRFVREVLL